MPTTFELIQFLLLFAVSIVFTAFALNRGSILTYLLAGLSWIATGLVNFIFTPTGGLSTALSYICVALGVICFVATFYTIGDAILERREDRWRVGLS